jgi:hypothetical protein
MITRQPPQLLIPLAEFGCPLGPALSTQVIHRPSRGLFIVRHRTQIITVKLTPVATT